MARPITAETMEQIYQHLDHWWTLASPNAKEMIQTLAFWFLWVGVLLFPYWLGRRAARNKDGTGRSLHIHFQLDGRIRYFETICKLFFPWRDNTQTLEVLLIYYARRSRLDVQALAKLFQAVTILRCFQKILIEFGTPLPAQLLTALLQELTLQSRQRNRPNWWNKPPDQTVRTLQIAGSQAEMEQMNRRLLGVESLRNLTIHFWGPRRFEIPRHPICAFRQALQNHPSLEQIHLSFSLLMHQIDETVVDVLVELVENNKVLTHLSLEIDEWELWFISPLAKALSPPSISARSNLKSLQVELPLAPHGLCDPVFTQYMVALEEMVQHNYNLQEVSVRSDSRRAKQNLLTDRHWGKPKELTTSPGKKCLPTPNPSLYYMMLNQMGRKLLLCNPNTTRQHWIETIVRDKDSVSVTFYWLSRNPTLLPTS